MDSDEATLRTGAGKELLGDSLNTDVRTHVLKTDSDFTITSYSVED